MSADQSGALDGVRVLDIGLLVQGPQAGLLLSDMGADVIKVELPGMGEQSRWIPLSMEDLRAPYFVGNNRGKRSITLDLRVDAGAEAFKKVVEGADVVISNFRPGTMEGWGLGYDDLAAVNPRIIYAAGSVFGALGPDADREGADLAGQAAGGIISTTGRDGGEPTPVGVTIADHIASQNMAAGVLAALYARERTGRGQRIDVSLVGGQVFAQAAEITAYLMTGKVPGRSNQGHPLLNAIYGIFPTADGHVAVVGVPPAQKKAFYEAIGRPELDDDPRFQELLPAWDDLKQLFAILDQVFPTRTTAEWCEILAASGQRYAPVRDYAEIAADPQMWLNGYLAEVEAADGTATKVVGSPITMSDTPTRPSAVTPELGQHTEEVLIEAGYGWDDIGSLRDRGAW